ncbi:hypothetical protein PMAC_000362 [Pneumocystis sp. 'macacae']|nr:hypothetical protein PMAC_000362 [Pneumocystis sp. 'macacae']
MNLEDESNDVKSRIIQSLFSYSTEDGEPLENYITHIKVLEESHCYTPSRLGSQSVIRKQRYILISVKNNGNVQIHKSRENNNGTFSIGKTWDMNELQRIDNVDACKVIITLQKPYYWICESAKDKAVFIEVLVKIYKKFTGEDVPVMNGFEEMKNSDIINYIPEDISALKRHSSISYTIQKNMSEPSSRRDSISGSQFQKNTQHPRPSSARYASGQSFLSSDSFYSHKPNKSYTEEAHSFLVNQIQRQNNQSLSSKNSSFERTSDLLKYEHELFSNKIFGNSAFQDVTTKTHDSFSISSNRESFEKNTFSNNLSNSLKKYTDYETAKIFNNEKDVEDFINYIDEMLDDFDWTELGNTERLEEKIKDELSTLQTANICAIIETNGRAVGLGERLMSSVKECENLSSLLALYSFGFNTIKDDIFHIETQNRGLQVQTANQKKLALELQNLLDTFSIDAHDLEALKKASLESTTGIIDIEKSLTFLYKALKISITSETDNEVPTGDVIIMEGKRAEYEKESNEFLSRLAHYLDIRFQLELANLIHTDYSPTSKVLKPQLVSHISTYMSFYRYQSFMLYAKQLNFSMFTTFQEYYIKYTSGFYNNDFEKFFNVWRVITKKDILEDADFCALKLIFFLLI